MVTHLEKGRGGSALKLKAASEFDRFWTSTLNKAQVGREGGRGQITHLEEGRGGSVCLDRASFWANKRK